MALMVPNTVALAAFASLVAAFELKVRFVEEPYLMRTHGDRYLDYASRTGRLLSELGRIEPWRT